MGVSFNVFQTLTLMAYIDLLTRNRETLAADSLTAIKLVMLRIRLYERSGMKQGCQQLKVVTNG